MESNSTGRWFCTASYMFCEASTKEQGFAGNTIVWGLQSWTHDVPISRERPGVKHSQGIKGFFHVLAKLLEAIHSKDLFSNILHLHTSCMKFFPKSRRRKTQNTPHTGFKAKKQLPPASSLCIHLPQQFTHLLVWRLRDCSWNKGPPSYFKHEQKLLTLLPAGKHGNEK